MTTLIIIASCFFFSAACIALTLIFAGMAGFNELDEDETIVVPQGDANTMPLIGLPKEKT